MSPEADARVTRDEPLTLKVVFDGAGVVLDRVEFQEEDLALGLAEDPPFEPVWIPRVMGVRTLRAVGIATDGQRWPADALTVTVTLAVSLPILTVADAYVIVEEAGARTGEARFQARLSEAASRPVTVDFNTRDGTADATDYTPVNGTLLFPPGVTERTVSVRVFANGLDEENESFRLELRNPRKCHLAALHATCQVYDENSPPVVDAVDVVVVEGDVDSEFTARIPLHLSRPSNRDVGVDIRTVEGTAQEMDWRNPEPGVSDF